MRKGPEAWGNVVHAVSQESVRWTGCGKGIKQQNKVGEAGWPRCCGTIKGMLRSPESERESCSVVSDSLWPHELYNTWNSPGQNTGVCSLSLLQGILPTQGSNSGLLHYRQILYQLSHQGSPRILEWVAYPLSRGSSWLRNWTTVSFIAGGFLTRWATRESLQLSIIAQI